MVHNIFTNYLSGYGFIDNCGKKHSNVIKIQIKKTIRKTKNGKNDYGYNIVSVVFILHLLNVCLLLIYLLCCVSYPKAKVVYCRHVQCGFWDVFNISNNNTNMAMRKI